MTKIKGEKSALWLLCGVQHSVIIADFILPETQMTHNYLIIYSSYFSKDLVEL